MVIAAPPNAAPQMLVEFTAKRSRSRSRANLCDGSAFSSGRLPPWFPQRDDGIVVRGGLRW